MLSEVTLRPKKYDLMFKIRDDGFEIKPKYYSIKRFLFLTRVLSFQDVFLRNMFYFILKITEFTLNTATQRSNMFLVLGNQAFLDY